MIASDQCDISPDVYCSRQGAQIPLTAADYILRLKLYRSPRTNALLLYKAMCKTLEAQLKTTVALLEQNRFCHDIKSGPYD